MFQNRALAAPAVQLNAPGQSGAGEPVSGDNLQGQMPRLVFESHRHHFGDVYRGQQLSYAFPFTNKGEGVLHIRSIHAACGCVGAKVEPQDSFPPGASGRIVFTLDTSLFAGPLLRTITVDSNVPAPSTITLSVAATIKEEVSAQPSMVSFSGIQKGSTKSQSLKLLLKERAPPIQGAQKDETPFKVTGVTSDSPHIEAVVVGGADKAAATGPVTLQVTLKPTMPPGSFKNKITVANNSTYLKELIVPVVGEIEGHIKVSTQYVEFGVVTAPAEVRRTLELQSATQPLKVTKIDIEWKTEGMVPALVVEPLQTSAKKVTVALTLRVPPGLALPRPLNAAGHLLLKTNNDDDPVIRIPFFGILRKEPQ